MPLKLRWWPGAYWREIAVGLGLTLAQLGLALAVAPAEGVMDRYLRLCSWDCAWYQSIAESGYHSVVPPAAQRPDLSNVAFFPAYPYLARAVHLATGMDVRVSLLLVAQFFCAVFWAALGLLLKRFKIPYRLRVLLIAAVFVHPAAFFLVAGYSESVFLASLLMFVLFSTGRSVGPPGRWLTSLWGLLMCATRMVGVPMALLPMLTDRSRFRGCLVGGLSSLGALGFLVYSGLRFGTNIYFDTQRIGWGVVPDYTAILHWSGFRYLTPLDRLATLSSACLFAGVPIFEWAVAPRRGRPERVALYLTAFCMFYVTLSGLVSVQFRSMIRYTLPWAILIMLAGGQAFSYTFSPFFRGRSWLIHAVGFAIAVALVITFSKVSLPAFRAFLSGQWFA